MTASRYSEIRTPALLLDLDRLKANVQMMAGRAARLGVALRPHIKTHKCLEIARLQLDAGAQGVTVSTIHEARVFAEAGFDYITWAFPIPIDRIEEAGRLTRMTRLGVVADSPEAVDALARSGYAFPVFLKIDTGYHRAGIDPGDELVLRLADSIHSAPMLEFCGILSHCGHSYDAATDEERAAIAEEDRRAMVELAGRLEDTGTGCPVVSVGSTPSMMSVTDLEGITEVRPGNYALFDYSQVERGVCEANDCAATVLSSVISSPEHLDHCIVDAGALAMSKEDAVDPQGGLGRLLIDQRSGIDPSSLLFSLSQEHGKLNIRRPVGSKVEVVPNHSCLTVACHDEFVVVREGIEIDRWRIHRGR